MVEASPPDVVSAEVELPEKLSTALQGDEAALLLRPGQIVRVSVLELFEPGEALLGLMGLQVRVKTTLQLQPGTELSLRVVPDGARILLRPLDSASHVVGGDPFRGILVKGPLARLLAGALTHPPFREVPRVAPLEPHPESTSPAATEFRAFHQLLGVGFERRILALPRLSAEQRSKEVLSLRESLRSIGGEIPGEPGPASGEPLRAPLLKLADEAAGWRGEQVSRAEHGMPFVYPLSLAEHSWLADGRLFLIHDEPRHAEGSRQQRAFTLVLLLDLTSLGSLRVDAAVSGSELSIEFTCTRESSAVKIREHARELEEAMQAAGLRLVSTNVRLRKDGSVPVLDLLPPPGEGASLLDLEL